MDTAIFIVSALLGVALRADTWLAALALGAFWASVRGRLRAARIASGALLLALLLIGFLPLGDALLRPLESTFPVIAEVDTVDGIILLGGGEDVPASGFWRQPQLGAGGGRYLGALALAHRHPHARILFAGGSARLRDLQGAAPTEAAIAEQLLGAQGIAPERLYLEDRSRNTAENARLGRALVDPAPGTQWVLVTSAFHMPRALRSFEAAGWQGIVPFPVDFRTRSWRDGLGWNFGRNLALLNTALREWVGRAAYAVSGR